MPKKTTTLTFPHISNAYVSHYQIFRRLVGEDSFSYLDQIENPTALTLVPYSLTGDEIIIEGNVVLLPDHLYFHSTYKPVVKYNGEELNEIEMTYSPLLKKIYFTNDTYLKDPTQLVIECFQNLVSYDYSVSYQDGEEQEYEYQVELVFKATHQVGTPYKLY